MCFWKAAWMRMCHSGVMSWAVAKTRAHLGSGTSSMWRTEPTSAIFFISSSRVEAALARHLLEVRVHLEHLVVVEHVART